MLLWRACAELRFLTREKRSDEGVVEIVSVLEIFRPIVVALAKNAGFDEVENQRTDVAAVLDAPFFEHGLRHRAELIERVSTKSFEQFRPAHVAARFEVFPAPESFNGFIENAAEKKVRVAVESRVALCDLLDGYFKFDFLHASEVQEKDQAASLRGLTRLATSGFELIFDRVQIA
ncbi:MAG: hypothetical protein ACI8UO_003153 [Verrucomicrobiales bacterium]|jgi:hypothetical protein